MENSLILVNRKIYLFVIYDIESIMNNILILQTPQEINKSVERIEIVNIPILFSKEAKIATQTRLVEPNLFFF